MDRLIAVVDSGGWQNVELYIQWEMNRLMQAMVDENSADKMRVLQGEIRGLRKLLRLRDDVLTYSASGDTSAPDEVGQPE